MEKPNMIIHAEKGLNYTAFDVKWIPKSAKESYILQIYELCDGNLELVEDIERPKALKCGTFGATVFEERHIAIGDFDGNLEIYDFNFTNSPIYSVQAHSEIINAIDGVGGLNIGKGAPEIVTGSRDGTVKVWDPRQKEKPVVCIEPEEEKEKRDCWAVAFGDAHSPEDRCVCAGFDNGDIKLFDLRKNSIRWETTLKNGICSLQFDRKDIEMNKLVATTLESNFTVFDMRTFHHENGYAFVNKKSHKSTVWCARHLPQNRDIFMTSGGNGSLNLWKYSYPPKRTKLLDDGSVEGVAGEVQDLNDAIFSSQPITSFDWCADKTGLCTFVGIDQTVKIGIITKLNTL
ncbi:WD repeat-containing protein 92 [Armadillidium nasatum]|uniref:WD repeat-containing protein 92 n=1 Tax=Armadillidium nasatum TaxID=96803 RepID=A0A5N5T887_9CRUS|nr:WD repeat-containing protein 92 [Armadillidium nasatum]